MDVGGAVLLLLRRRLVILSTIATFGIVMALVVLLSPRTFTVNVLFMPSVSGGSSGRLAGLAAQIGLSAVADAAGTNSPYFYVDLLESQPFLERVVGMSYPLPGGDSGRTGNLAQAFELDAASPPELIVSAVERLRESVAVTVATKTGVVNVRVRTEDAALSASIAANMLAELERFNKQVRRSQAGEERRFIESRADSAVTELRRSEDQLQQFLRENRLYQESPDLRFTFDRLSRAVSSRAALHASLLQALDQARMEEVRSTPVLSVIESPRAPITPDRRRLVPRLFLALVIGAFAGVALAAFVDLSVRRLESSPELREALLGAMRNPFASGSHSDA
jgi:uncharacterized protein involved in exopolysaccharide biosynthesis